MNDRQRDLINMAMFCAAAVLVVIVILGVFVLSRVVL